MTTRDKVTQVLRIREAGRVRRCHTMTVVKEQDLAQHSYNMVMLLDVLYPETSASYYRLLRYCLWHDLHERYTGDVPASLRYFDPSIREKFKEASRYVEGKLGFPVPDLNDGEERWVKALDQLEFLLHCHDEINMGNQHIKPYLDDMREWFFANRGKVPQEVRDFVAEFSWYRTAQKI